MLNADNSPLRATKPNIKAFPRATTILIAVAVLVAAVIGLMAEPSKVTADYRLGNPWYSTSTKSNNTGGLFQHNLSSCFTYPTALDPLLQTIGNHPTFSQRLLCYCIEELPSMFDNRNCFIRVRNATIHHRAGGGKGLVSFVYLTDSPVPFTLRVDNSRFALSEFKVVVKGLGPCASDDGSSLPSQKSCTFVPNFEGSHPYTTMYNFTASPILFIPVLAIHVNFYHSQFGPTGVLQIQSARELINSFYHHSSKGAVGSTTRSSNASPQLVGHHIRYTFTKGSPRISIANRGSCNNMNFKSDLLDSMAANEYTTGKDSRFEDVSHLYSSREDFDRLQSIMETDLPQSYLSREMLYGDIFMSQATNGVESPLDWFGRRMGFCLQELPQNTFAAIDDMWINIPLLQLGSQRLVRRATFAGEPVAPIVLADEFYGVCPLKEEELSIGRHVADQMKEHLETHEPALLSEGSVAPPTRKDNLNRRSFTHRSCLPVRRNIGASSTKEAAEKFCVLVVGRPLSKGANGLSEGVRGLPIDIEHFILNSLLLPSTMAKPNSLGGAINDTQRLYGSRWWDSERSLQCSVSSPKEIEWAIAAQSAKVVKDGVATDNFASAIDSLNFESGLPPCTTATFEQPNMYFVMSFSHKIQSRQKDSAFFPKDKYYQWDTLVRTSFDGMPLAHQYTQVKAANLFIFEEGAPLAWAAHARNGSTFIIVYSSSAMRVSKGHTKKKSKAKHNGQMQGGVTSSIDFFALFPQLSGRVRLIFLVHLYGRFPAFSRLREVFDMPWRADTYIIACECNATRVAPWADTRHQC